MDARHFASFIVPKLISPFMLFYVAVKVADKMQKEVTAKRSLVDTLQSKVRWLEDQIDTLIKVHHTTCLCPRHITCIL